MILFLAFAFMSIQAQEKSYFKGGNVCETNSWKLVFHDEFNGNALDTSKWYTYYPYGKNKSDQCDFCRTHADFSDQVYQDENLSIEDGILKILTQKEELEWMGKKRNYSSGLIHSKQVFDTYTKYEIKCKIPDGKGTWPAFWVFGWSTEIDVFEIGKNKKRANMTVHKWKGDKSENETKRKRTKKLSDDFHVFTVEYEPYFVKFSIDGELVYTINKYKLRRKYRNACELKPGDYKEVEAFPNYGDKVQVIASMAVGSDSAPRIYGKPNKKTKFPNVFEIDYIRVYQREIQSDLKALDHSKISN